MHHSSNYIHILNMLVDKNIKVLSNITIGEDDMEFKIEYSKDFYKYICLKYSEYISSTRVTVEGSSFIYYSQEFKYDNLQLLILKEEINNEYMRLFNDLKNGTLGAEYFTANFKNNIKKLIDECTD